MAYSLSQPQHLPWRNSGYLLTGFLLPGTFLTCSKSLLILLLQCQVWSFTPHWFSCLIVTVCMQTAAMPHPLPDPCIVFLCVLLMMHVHGCFSTVSRHFSAETKSHISELITSIVLLTIKKVDAPEVMGILSPRL